MPWTPQQTKAFPHRELQQHLSKQATRGNLDTEKKYQGAVQAWRKYVVPHTPSEPELASRGILHDSVAVAMIGLLKQTSEDPYRSPHPPVASLQLVDIWPTMWIWIQLLHARHVHIRETVESLSEERLELERNNYEGIVQSLAFCLGAGLDPMDTANGLTKLVRSTKGVMEMAAKLWVDEAKDERAFMGFYASCLRSPSLVRIRPQMDRLLIASCGGSEETAELSFARILRNFRRTRFQIVDLSGPDADKAYKQLHFELCAISDVFLDLSSALFSAYEARRGCAAFFVNVIFSILDPLYLPPRLDVVSAALTCLRQYTVEVKPFSAVRELVESPFFNVITRPSLTTCLAKYPQQAAHVYEHCGNIIKTMRMFSVYRINIRQLHRSLSHVSEFTEKNRTSIATHLRDLRSRLEERHRAYQDYKSKHKSPIFCCGNKLERAWQGDHKVLCNAMSDPTKAFLSFRDADFRWLAYLITKDIFKDLESTADRLTAAQRSDALPLVNYLKTPTERVYLPVGSVIKTVGLPSGSIRDAWISSLGPRISIRPDLRATQTTPYLIVLPHLHETSAVLTILVTYPKERDIVQDDLHITWIFHH
ncbi:hypothetical protein HWV62_14562 [Athelia sp. TMB]|nr:hypothetical protein HWV62_14562 [Athelia sp. TMB]